MVHSFEMPGREGASGTLAGGATKSGDSNILAQPRSSWNGGYENIARWFTGDQRDKDRIKYLDEGT